MARVNRWSFYSGNINCRISADIINRHRLSDTYQDVLSSKIARIASTERKKRFEITEFGFLRLSLETNSGRIFLMEFYF